MLVAGEHLRAHWLAMNCASAAKSPSAAFPGEA